MRDYRNFLESRIFFVFTFAHLSIDNQSLSTKITANCCAKVAHLLLNCCSPVPPSLKLWRAKTELRENPQFSISIDNQRFILRKLRDCCGKASEP